MRLLIAAAVFLISIGTLANAKTVDLTIDRNVTTNVHGLAIYNEKCQYMRVRTKIRVQPQHGQAEVKQFASKFNDDHRCAGRTAQRAGFVYRPNSGFVGSDKVVLTYTVMGTVGRSKTYRFVYNLTVK